MGLLRFLLVIGIISRHYTRLAPGHEKLAEVWAHTPSASVHLLYFMVGFYTTAQLRSQFSGIKNHMPLKFYAYRFIHLAPVYYFTLALYLVAGWYLKTHTANSHHLLYYKTFYQFSASDWLKHLFVFIPQLFKVSPHPGDILPAHILAIGGNYVVASEIVFIIIAPFLLVRWRLWAATLIALAMAITYYQRTPIWDNSMGQYLVASFVYFLMGMLCHDYSHHTLKWFSQIPFKKPVAYGMALIIFAGVFALNSTQGDAYLPFYYILFFAAITVCIPFIYAATIDSTYDRMLFYSYYPILFVNILLIWIIDAYPIGHAYLFVVIVSILYAVFCHQCIDNPIRRACRHLLDKLQK